MPSRALRRCERPPMRTERADVLDADAANVHVAASREWHQKLSQKAPAGQVPNGAMPNRAGMRVAPHSSTCGTQDALPSGPVRASDRRPPHPRSRRDHRLHHPPPRRRPVRDGRRTGRPRALASATDASAPVLPLHPTRLFRRRDGSASKYDRSRSPQSPRDAQPAAIAQSTARPNTTDRPVSRRTGAIGNQGSGSSGTRAKKSADSAHPPLPPCGRGGCASLLAGGARSP